MRYLMLVAVVLLGTGWMIAQTTPDQNQNANPAAGQTASQPDQNANQAQPQHRRDSKETTIQGCLGGSEGNFTLTDKSGIAYRLIGDSSKLKDHVGHEVEVKGEAGPPKDKAKEVAAGNDQPMFTVKSIKHLAESCSK